MIRALTSPMLLLRIEGGVLLLLCLVLFAHIGGNWIAFALLLLAPDLSMVGYLLDPRRGAAIYNTVHMVVSPAVVALAGLFTANGAILAVAIIWFSHISMDRLFGYGLKRPTAFADTHLSDA